MHMSQAHVRQGRLRLQPGACSPHLRALFLGSEEFKDATLTSPDNFSILPDDSPASASSTSKGAPPTMMVQKTLYDRCQQQHDGADNQGDGGRPWPRVDGRKFQLAHSHLASARSFRSCPCPGKGTVPLARREREMIPRGSRPTGTFGRPLVADQWQFSLVHWPA